LLTIKAEPLPDRLQGIAMNRFAAAACAALLSCSAAQAADYPNYELRPSIEPHGGSIWQGVYFGGNAGWSTGSGHNDGAFGGVHAGYSAADHSGLVAVEADVQFARILSDEVRWFSTLRGRFGLPFGNFLLYATGGLAIGGHSKTHVGWTAGAGVETALNHELSVRLEYLYADFGTHAGADLKTHMFRVGATAHF
jgi:outer membrane immunogenic protein